MVGCDAHAVTSHRGQRLTFTEVVLVDLAARGTPPDAIAAELGLGAEAVERHLARVYAKLGVRSQAELSARSGLRRPAADTGGER